MASTEEPSRSRLDECFSRGAFKLPANSRSPSTEVHTSSQYCGMPPTRLASIFLLQLLSHLLMALKKKGYEHLPPLNMSVAAHLCPPTAIWWKVRASHTSKPCRATSALAGCDQLGWASGFSAALYGCALGLPGQDARQRGSRSGCSFTQGEERDRPGSTCHHSHRPGSIMMLFHCVVRLSSTRLIMARHGSVRVGLHFHRSLVPL